MARSVDHGGGDDNRRVGRRAARLAGVLALAALLAGRDAAAEVLLVRGTVSAPAGAERRYAAATARRVGRWLEELGVAWREIDDEQVGARALAGARVAVLPYNPRLPEAERAALAAFVERGGRLVVFYSSDAELARLMDMRLEGYTADIFGTRWCRIVFGRHAPDGAPEGVYQTSRSLCPAVPRRGRGKVAAWWHDAVGRRQEPAWSRTAAGFWMSHVLLDDGDTWNKKRMLLAVLGALDPGVWPPAAAALRRRAETLDRYGSYAQAVEAIRRRAGAATAPRVEELLAGAGSRRAVVEACLDQGEYAGAVVQAAALREALERAYAAGMPPADERRAVWEHSGLGLYPGDWARTGEVLRRYGITDLFVNILWPGKVHLPGNPLPRSRSAERYGDQMAACLEGCAGVRVHVWKVCWNLGGAEEEFVEALDRAGRLQRDAEGRRVRWLCPSNPENLRSEKESLRDVLARYPVAGVHLDYVRYPDGDSCYCDGCRRRFEADLGRRVAVWPDEAHGGPLTTRYREWRARQITALVRDVSVFARRMRPGIEVSAAVFGKYPACRDNVSQDWVEWVRRGYLDFVAPMNYHDDPGWFRDILRNQCGQVPSPARLLPGIGVTATESRLDAVGVIEQIEAARRAGTAGYALFDLSPVLEHEVLPILGEGPFSRPSAPPPGGGQ